MIDNQMIYTSMEELPLVLKTEDVGAVLGIGRNNAYAVVHSKGFPATKIGKQYRIPRDKFIVWMNNVTEVEIAS